VSGQQQQQQSGGQEQQQQQSGGQQRLSAPQGMTVIKDQLGMQQLVQTLADAEAWSFSLAFESDFAGTTCGPVNPTGLALPKPPTPPGKRSNKKAAAAAAAAAAEAACSDFGWDDEPTVVGASHSRSIQQQQQQRNSVQEEVTEKQPWSWNVVGVAFSTGDGCAFVVPLTNSSGGGGSSGGPIGSGDMQRAGTSHRLRDMWAGLQAIFSSKGAAGDGGDVIIIDGSDDRNAAQQAVDEPTTHRSRLQLLSAAAQHAAQRDSGALQAAQQQQLQNVPRLSGKGAAKTWFKPGPVKVTFSLKNQMAVLSQPPAALGLPGIRISEPFLDVRVAAWCLSPEGKGVEEGNWSGSTGCRYV
jgi:hypothetical protein